MIEIDEVATGVLINAISTTARLLRVASTELINRRRTRDTAIARSLDTQRLTERIPSLPDLSPAQVEQLAEILRSDEVQAVLQELLSARLAKKSNESAADLAHIRSIWKLTFAGQGSASTADTLFDHYDNDITKMVQRLEKEEPTLIQQIRDRKLQARTFAILTAIERHLAVLSAQSDRGEESDFLIRYRRQVIDYHGKIEPPDLERRRRIPFEDIYVPTSILRKRADNEKDSPGLSDDNVSSSAPDVRLQQRNNPELNIWTLAGLIDRTVLLGDPGAGKTTAANVLAHYFASNSTQRIPFFVTLRTFAAQDPPQHSVVEHIEYMLKTFYQCEAPTGLVNRLLATGRAVVIFDGLDELVDISRRIDVSTRVERFCFEYPLASALVTSRAVGYEQARLNDREFTTFWLGGFTDDQFDQYVNKWFAQEEGLTAPEAEQSIEAFKEESASIPDLRTNPLLLSLMCILYRGGGSLPRNRAEIYEQCANLLFHKWDARRKIHSELRASHLLEPALRHLAWWLFTRNRPQPTVTASELITETTAFLHHRGFEIKDDARQAASEFVDFCRGRMWVFTDVGTTGLGKHLYSFTHRTFLEYFAAAYLAYHNDTAEQLANSIAPHIMLREWDVVAELAIQIKDRTSEDGAQRMYVILLGSCSEVQLEASGYILEFLARCLRSVEPSPQITRNLAQACLDHYFALQPQRGTHGSEVDQGGPLGWLLAAPIIYRELVADELSTGIGARIRSANEPSRRSAATLADGLFNALPPSFTRKAEWTYWHTRSHEIALEHADAILKAAKADSSLWDVAIRHRLTTVEQLREIPEAWP